MRPAWLDLPVRTALPALTDALGEHGSAVLAAPPGTGKTTLVPLALAGLVPPADGPPRRVVVAEPRRMAARAAARRMAWLLEEDINGRDGTGSGRIGYTVRGERRAGPRTLVEVVTTGVLLQRLQRDPELPGVDAVLIDECHERHLDADTAAAFLLDIRAALRPDLRLIAASATTDADAWARLLAAPGAAGPAPVVRADDALHPVDVRYAPPPRPVRPPHGMHVDPALLGHVAATVRSALHRDDGDLLCFLPGVGEIGRVAGLLDGVDAEVLQLHGRVPGPAQDAVLRGGGGRRRVILSTSVAESSLTVPGARLVVDAGLSREPRTDHARGLGALTTVRSSAATAGQRTGRAGREAPGVAYRCWAHSEDAARPRWPAPEITVADLTPFALQAACWGDPDASSLALLDAPPAGALAAAREVLRAVGAVDSHGRVTERGTRLARLGLHPRLGRALVDGAAQLGPRRAAEVVALLSEEPPRNYGDDLAGAWRSARRGGDGYAARWAAETRRLRRALEASGSTGPAPGTAPSDDAAAGLVAALAHPERIARRRTAGAFLMASGTAAQLGDGSRLGASEWLAVAVADRPVTAGSARVRLAAVIDEATARTAGAPLHASGEEVGWSAERGDVTARHVERIGAVELAVRPLTAPDPALVRGALLEGLRREGLGLLRWTRDAADLRRRMAFLHRELGEPWPDVSDAALLDRAPEWLGPELATARRRADLERVDAGQVLVRLLPWACGEAARFDELAPERLQVPSGSRIRLDYSGERPVLAVKLQELFGLQETPRIADGAVPLLVHLLSPAGRPAAVTSDLASFWREGYRSVRSELRGRYPKHPWPEDPAAAEPTRHTKARTGRG
ncbi:ATP-dependent helicase HrpB [Streptomyces meridianus]|uniref:ATP-dependent helicase HrpB n=1 Tax=Streptomyces meridianus TaxID=2938945 RepID=A0ABT0X1V6_9ACTN|nr:ATP-dependent helicase HrpB [Streptomyces meridianus]MCM2576532.1 ATP-dependent helicase HrpB [Streptomyces meridianus]